MAIEMTHPDIYRAINALQKYFSTQAIGKDGYNKEHNYNFRQIDSVYNALSSPLAEHGVAIFPFKVERTDHRGTTAKGGDRVHVSLLVTWRLLLTDNPSSFQDIPIPGDGSDTPGDKAVAKAMSMSYKDLAVKTFCIPVVGEQNAEDDTISPIVAADPLRELMLAAATDIKVALKVTSLEQLRDARAKALKAAGEDKFAQVMLAEVFTAAKGRLLAQIPQQTSTREPGEDE